MKSLAYVLFLFVILQSCSEPRGHREVLSRVLSVMNEHPDSALRILDSLGEHEQQFGCGFLMRYRLHRTNALNKLDTVFSSTTEVQQLADYFDSHGTANEQMLAHYLLGRAYYDTGESPMALKCFQDAAAKADTTAKDCDYRQLSFVYGQMGTLFWRQNLIKNGIECSDMAIKYAWMGKDTLNALLNMADKIELYENMNMNDSALYFCYTVNSLLKKYGYKQSAASVLGISIDMLIDKGEISKAKHNIDIYEAETGYFDSLGNIQKGREVYYSLKGEYYMAVNKYDSAEYYFRKELRDGKDFNNQNVGARGLALLFQRTNRPDSAAKYALYSYDMNDSVYAHMATKEVENSYSLYNYIHNQEKAQLEKERAEAAQSKVVWLVCVLFALFFLGIYFFIREKMERNKKHRKYMKTVAALMQAQSDVDRLKEHRLYIEQLLSVERQKCLELSTLSEDEKAKSEKIEADAEQMKNQILNLQKIIAKKEDIIFQLKSDLPIKYKMELEKNDLSKVKLIHHKNYVMFSELVVKGQMPDKIQWQQINAIVADVLPGFNDFLSSKKQFLNDKELHTCILIRLSVKPTTIADMLGVTPAYISKIRSEMLKRLFGVSGTSKDFDKLLMQMT